MSAKPASCSLILLLAACMAAAVGSPRAVAEGGSSDLEAQLRGLIVGFKGTVTLHARHLESGA